VIIALALTALKTIALAQNVLTRLPVKKAKVVKAVALRNKQ
jgi:hypothetical protein